jgi:bla regulator protein blaR1
MTELSLIAKATIVLAMGLAVARLARRARASIRHLVLVATFATLLVLPMAALVLPAIEIGVPVGLSAAGIASPQASRDLRGSRTATSAAPTGTLAANHTETPPPVWGAILRLVWGAGTTFLLASLAVALWRLRRIRRTALPCLDLRDASRALAADADVRRQVEIVAHEQILAPLTCGVRHATIVLPSDIGRWSAQDTRRALIHELEHVRRGDWTMQLIARLVCSVYWFHPLVWSAWRQLCLDAERACDDAVVRAAEGPDYAEQLVSLARRLSHAAAAPLILSMASRSDLAARVSALLDPRQRRGRAGVLWTAATAALAALVIMTIAPLHAVASPAGGGTESATLIEALEPAQRRGTSLDRALFRAAERGDVNRMTELIDAGANVNSPLQGDGSPLIAAAREGRFAAVKLLLDRGADPNMGVGGDGNPLIMAAREGHVDIVAMLLDRGAQIDLVVPSDENALIQASGEGRLPVVTLLVARGADVNARVWADSGYERQGEWRTPLSMARRGRHTAVIELLRSAGAQE